MSHTLRTSDSRRASALGAIYTAAPGAAEAFKYTATILSARRVPHRHLRICVQDQNHSGADRTDA
jgi:hypothetical protein